MRADLTARVQGIIGRIAAIDWRCPRHDPKRAAAAYERWLAIFGVRRQVRWVADPAEAWQLPPEYGVHVWAMVAASNPARSSTIRLLINDTAGETSRWGAFSTGAVVAGNWAFAVTVPMAAAEGVLNAWFAAWTQFAAGKATRAHAMALLCSPFQWPAPAPPVMASAAADALAACSDPIRWAALADVLVGKQNNTGETAKRSSDIKVPTREALIEDLIAIAEPMVDACEAGAFAHVLLAEDVVVLAAPSIWTDGRALHRADGPAIAWPRTKAYAWKGVLVPERAIIEPQSITPDMIRFESAPVLQHALIDIFAHTHGHPRCMQDLGGVMMHEDHTGRLWWFNPNRDLRALQPGDLKMVEVTNGTAEADGSCRTYWLNVPPEMRSAKAAVAWTYGMTPEQYDGLVMRT
jgi:hypothetical protein